MIDIQPMHGQYCASMNTDQLMELRSHAQISEDNVEKTAIYTKLEKRCEHQHHRFMNDPMMDQTLDQYQLFETTLKDNNL